MDLRSGLSEEELLSVRRVLVVAPHPDDETFGCGGTIARLAQGGALVEVAIVSDGAALEDHRRPGRGDVVAARRREAEAAGRHLGVTRFHFLGHPDGALAGCTEAVARDVARLAEAIGPDLALGPSVLDYHEDHMAVGRAVLAAAARDTTWRLAIYAVYGPVRFNTLVDVTETMTAKVAALREYRVSLLGDPEPYVEAARGLGRFWTFYTRVARDYEPFLVLEPGRRPTEQAVRDWLTFTKPQAPPPASPTEGAGTHPGPLT